MRVGNGLVDCSGGARIHLGSKFGINAVSMDSENIISDPLFTMSSILR